MANIKNIRTLESIAVRIRDLAVAKAPKSKFGSNGNPPGNLRNKIKSANTPAKSKMVKVSDKEISISLDYAPTGAEYGQWFNEPPSPVSNRRKKLKATAIKKGNWNYAIDALNDADLSKEFNDFIDELRDLYVEEIEIEFDKK